MFITSLHISYNIWHWFIVKFMYMCICMLIYVNAVYIFTLISRGTFAEFMRGYVLDMLKNIAYYI